MFSLFSLFSLRSLSSTIMIKKITKLTVFVTLALVIASCSSDTEDAQAESQQSTLEQQATTSEAQKQAPVAVSNQAPDSSSNQQSPDECCDIDGDRISNADSDAERGNWLAHGRDYGEQRFSPLTQINDSNVEKLGLAWYLDTDTNRGHEASPIVIDGRLFYTAPWSIVYAADARTGELLWKYDPNVDKAWGVHACCDVVNRGVAVWKGKVYVGTLDGRLEALDAITGEVIWSVKTIPEDRPYTITGAPRVVKDMVIIGNGGAEFGVRGYITAYDSETGDQMWRFYTVPGNPSTDEDFTTQQVSSTWGGGPWWEIGGGGTVWDSMAYDAELDLLYIGVGNGSPWNRSERSPAGGDNLFLSSIVALKPDTGDYVWHFQTTPGDTWDYTATQHIILADLEVDGVPRKALMQAPKNGYFYVLDRETGEFISGEEYVQVSWAEGLDEKGRPIETAHGRYEGNVEGQVIFPSPFGGHNWHPMSFSPETGLVYIPAMEIPFAYADDPLFEYRPGLWNTGIGTDATIPTEDADTQAWLAQVVKGQLIAWDPVEQAPKWSVTHPYPWNGGLLSTAGNLVFQGNATGELVAYRADTGDKLWQSSANTGIIAPPISYSIDGEQYIALVAGYGGAFALAGGVNTRLDTGSHYVGRLLVYKLGGTEVLPKLPTPAKPATPPSQKAREKSESFIAQGESLYHTFCATCHGPGVIGGGLLPDLRWSSHTTFDQFEEIVIDGIRSEKGMVSFKKVIDRSEAKAIKAYILDRAHKDHKNW